MKQFQLDKLDGPEASDSKPGTDNPNDKREFLANAQSATAEEKPGARKISPEMREDYAKEAIYYYSRLNAADQKGYKAIKEALEERFHLNRPDKMNEKREFLANAQSATAEEKPGARKISPEMREDYAKKAIYYYSRLNAADQKRYKAIKEALEERFHLKHSR
ncbi:hypothetical protein [Acrocarpospora catenulata]|uniref:hypothetical protein n=1 Tax=Acrocarpospora catenulata TaxID=2836182 RepID=UPI001BDB4909|nr:hypothetical protein [Acrocarpospora catenulata]